MDINLSAVTGLAVTAQLFLAGVASGSPISVPEIGDTGEYAADVPGGTAAGEYLVVFSTAAGKLGAGKLLWDGSAEISAQAVEVWQGLNAESGYTPLDILKIISAILAGKASIAGNTITFRDINDTIDRVVSISTAEGGRTEVTADVS